VQQLEEQLKVWIARKLFGVLAFWSIGCSEYWLSRVLAFQSIGFPEYWLFGVLAFGLKKIC
jgi:hypothetical protein